MHNPNDDIDDSTSDLGGNNVVFDGISSRFEEFIKVKSKNIVLLAVERWYVDWSTRKNLIAFGLAKSWNITLTAISMCRILCFFLFCFVVVF